MNNLLRHKAHLQLSGNNPETWVRYTLGSELSILNPKAHVTRSLVDHEETGTTYQQLNLNHRHTHHLNSKLELENSIGLKTSEIVIGENKNQWREDELFGRSLIKYKPNNSHRLALGIEGTYDHFGEPTLLAGVDTTNLDKNLDTDVTWESAHHSLFSEYQWYLSQKLLLVNGLRIDKHDFTGFMYSPRSSLIYSPSSNDVIKLMFNRSVRKQDEIDLYINYTKATEAAPLEEILSYEIRYEKFINQSNHVAASVFYNDLGIVAWDNKELTSIYLGDVRTYGFDFEWMYHGEQGQVNFSHNYTKLLALDTAKTLDMNNVSAEPYGYGDDLANWSPHSSKFMLNYYLSNTLTASSSLRAYWWLPGALDLANYNKAENESNPAAPIYKKDQSAFEASIFLNLGIEYHIWKTLKARLDGYNLLGLIDEDLNKRNYFQRASMYSTVAPAVAVSVKGYF